MDETGDSMGSEPNKELLNTSAVKVKPKKKSLVERELETSLTSKATSPILLGEGASTSRYGRARRLKTDTDFCDTEKAVTNALKSPKLQISPKHQISPKPQISPVKDASPSWNSKSSLYKTEISFTTLKSEPSTPTKNVRRKSVCGSTPTKESPKLISAFHPNIENQINSIYKANISLSRFNEGSYDAESPTKKTSKMYIRKDLIQTKEKEETITLIKNMFSPTKSPHKKNSHLNNILERSSEKYNLTPLKSPKPTNSYENSNPMSPAVQIPNTEKASKTKSRIKIKSNTQNLTKVAKHSAKNNNKSKSSNSNNLNYILQRLSEKLDLKVTKSLRPRSTGPYITGRYPERNTLNSTKLSKPQNMKTIPIKSEEKQVPNSKSPKLLNTKSPKTQDTKSLKILETNSPKGLNIKSQKILSIESPKVLNAKSQKILNTKSPKELKIISPKIMDTKSPKGLNTKSLKILDTKSPKTLNTLVVHSTERNGLIPTKTTKPHTSSNIEVSTGKNVISETNLTPGTNSVVKILDFDSSKILNTVEKYVTPSNELLQLEENSCYQVGDLTWARMGTYPFWPCIVTREPGSELFVKKKLFGRIERDMFHVTFFGDNGRRSWIVDSMLRQFRGRAEFEEFRDQFTSEDKKKDPRFYAAFFISEKKKLLWGTSVEEAETLYRGPRNLRIDMLYDMLGKSRIAKTETETEKSLASTISRVSRIDSDVSLSESLYDSLFSEDDGVNDSERSRNKTKNKSLDVSEVVTACLDNMAAKTGITKIQRQSHMDIWLQKAKSKTPEKLNVSITVERMDDEIEPKVIQDKETEKIETKSKSKKKKPLTPTIKVSVPYSFRKHVAESRNLQPFGYPCNEHDYSIKTDNIENCPANINEQEPPSTVLQTEEAVMQSSDECQNNSYEEYSDIMPVTGDILEGNQSLFGDASISVDNKPKLGDTEESTEDENHTNVEKDSNICKEIIISEKNITEIENVDEKDTCDQLSVINNEKETSYEEPLSPTFTQTVDQCEDTVTRSPSPTYTQNFEDDTRTSPPTFTQTTEFSDLERDIESPTFTQTEPFEHEDKINKVVPDLTIYHNQLYTDSVLNNEAKKAIEEIEEKRHTETSSNEAEEEIELYAHLVNLDNHVRSKDLDVFINGCSKDEDNGGISQLDTSKDKKTEVDSKKPANGMNIDESTNCENLNAIEDPEIRCDEICNQNDKLCNDNYAAKGHNLQIEYKSKEMRTDQESINRCAIATEPSTLVEKIKDSPVTTNGHATDDEIYDFLKKKLEKAKYSETEIISLNTNHTGPKTFESRVVIDELPNYAHIVEINDLEIKLNNHERDITVNKKDSVESDRMMHEPQKCFIDHQPNYAHIIEINDVEIKLNHEEGTANKTDSVELKKSINKLPSDLIDEQPNYAHIIELNDVKIKLNNDEACTADIKDVSDRRDMETTILALPKNTIEINQSSDHAESMTIVKCDGVETHNKVLKILCERIPGNDDSVTEKIEDEIFKENGYESDNDSMSSELDNVALSELKLTAKRDAFAKYSIKSDDTKSDTVDMKSDDFSDLKSDDLNDTSYVPSSEDLSELSEVETNELPSNTQSRRRTSDVRMFTQALKSGEDISEPSEINIDDLASRVKIRRRTTDGKMSKQDQVKSNETAASDNESLLSTPISMRRRKSVEPSKVNEFSINKELSPDTSAKIKKEETDIDIISINSDDSATIKRKIKPRKELIHSKQDPEFLKYLELRQDALMDEHPELNEDEIIPYLYKTWLYEESMKSDIKKTDDIQQSTLVKGSNQDNVPKTNRKSNKSKRVIDINKIISNDCKENLKVEPKSKPRRKAAVIRYVDDLSDIEDEIRVFEIIKDKSVVDLTATTEIVSATSENTGAVQAVPKLTAVIKSESGKPSKLVTDKSTKFTPESVNKVETAVAEKSEVEVLDEIENYFQQLVEPKPNVFKGLVREKVCEVCEKPSDLVKCKGCNGMFHVECNIKKEEVEPPPPAVRGRKKKKTRVGRKPKTSTDSNLDESHSDDKTADINVSEELNISMQDNSQSITVILDDFEEKAAAKMKEILEAETAYDSYSSDDGHDWSDTVAGKCEIVDVKLKPRSQPVDNIDFKCLNCQKYETPICFICKSDVSPKSQVLVRQRCQVAHCHKYYHVDCLDLWPQTQFNGGEPSKKDKKISEHFEALTCPRHVCHTCVCDDPRGCKTRFSGDKLARCVRCPATYHTFTKCLPAGTQILTASHIICPRHNEHRPGKVPCHVNTGWCFICAQGGSLICCEYCPTSFHAECLQIKPPEGGYMCEDCETGRLPLYGEMVWVKLGHYRWWPGIVLHPCEIPDNIMAVRHSPGEFVVRFFGQYDHYWVNRGRVFPFQEGDSGRISSQKSKIDEAFTMAVDHAHRAFQILKSAAPNEEESSDIASSLLPPHYVKLKVNKPCGSLCGKKIDIEESSLTQCGCDPNGDEPCGPYTRCLNRMLLTECGPNCLAGDRCKNRDFEKRNYPKMVPYRTPYRGWGLKTLEPIRAGQFVIEYVGELIDEEEFRRRMTRQHEVRDENFYYLTLDKERMIDAGPKGNLARFMNHSCEPNCETQKWTVLGDVRVGLFAIKDIPANTEVNFNYNLECAGIEKKRCLCGAKRCSGYIGAKPKQEESLPKKPKVVLQKLTKRPYKKRIKNPTEGTSPTASTSVQNPEVKRKRGRPRKVEKPRELTEIEKDLLIIKNAISGLSSDSESNPRNSETETKEAFTLKRERDSLSTEDTMYDDSSSPSVKRMKIEEGSSVGD